MAPDRSAAATAIADFLKALGHDPAAEPELAGTPLAVAAAFADELLVGYSVNVQALLEGAACSSPSTNELVFVRDISVNSLCPHHLMPSFGSAELAYVPGSALLGLGALARLVDAFSRRLTLQEAIARHVVDALIAYGGARGARCTLTLRHTCLSCRGARQSSASVTTTATAGCLLEPGWSLELCALARGAVE